MDTFIVFVQQLFVLWIVIGALVLAINYHKYFDNVEEDFVEPNKQ